MCWCLRQSVCTCTRVCVVTLCCVSYPLTPNQCLCIVQVRIKEARGLPPTLANFVVCQYIMWGYPEPIGVPPVVHSENQKQKKIDDISIKFDHCKVSNKSLQY